jgi:hypothetical protein
MRQREAFTCVAANTTVEGIAKSCALGSLRATRSGAPHFHVRQHMRKVLYYMLVVPLVGLLILSTHVYGQLRRVVKGTPDENNALLSAPGCRYRSIFCRGTRKSLLSINSGIFLWTYYQALLGKTTLGRFGFRGKDSPPYDMQILQRLGNHHDSQDNFGSPKTASRLLLLRLVLRSRRV